MDRKQGEKTHRKTRTEFIDREIEGYQRVVWLAAYYKQLEPEEKQWGTQTFIKLANKATEAKTPKETPKTLAIAYAARSCVVFCCWMYAHRVLEVAAER